ncbi:UBA/TS-N domain [Phytophthora pseudosyringae]|uniref:UBA/TS-N domain n=1 Tax=Phytophthora pseudosyringae TaxID=221518 RepID=A0A8T1W7X8_9STRA|nr:UBA/TS-N domain [Phytophthora pseudosyringae]
MYYFEIHFSSHDVYPADSAVSASGSSSSGVLLLGKLMRRDRIFFTRKWHDFVLERTRLQYFTTKGYRKGDIPLSPSTRIAIRMLSEPKPFGFLLTITDTKLTLAAATKRERDQWIDVFRGVFQAHVEQGAIETALENAGPEESRTSTSRIPETIVAQFRNLASMCEQMEETREMCEDVLARLEERQRWIEGEDAISGQVVRDFASAHARFRSFLMKYEQRAAFERLVSTRTIVGLLRDFHGEDNAELHSVDEEQATLSSGRGIHTVTELETNPDIELEELNLRDSITQNITPVSAAIAMCPRTISMNSPLGEDEYDVRFGEALLLGMYLEKIDNELCVTSFPRGAKGGVFGAEKCGQIGLFDTILQANGHPLQHYQVDRALKMIKAQTRPLVIRFRKSKRVQQLLDMGFSRELAVEALQKKNGDVQAAANYCFEATG